NGQIVARSSGGNIQLLGITGSVDAETSGGDILTKLKPSGSGKNTIQSAGGQISLYIPSTAHVTIDATIRIRGRWATRSQESTIHSEFKAASYEKNEQEQRIHGVYELNGGGETITLETVNSNIEILPLK